MTTAKPETPSTQKPPGAASWQDPPARISSSLSPAQSASKNPDVEIFDPKPKLNVTVDNPKNIQNNPETYEPPNINIEIHNVLSFGNDPTKNVTREVNSP